MKNKTASFETTILEAHVFTFANLTGDYNKLHVDKHYATRTNFKRQIVHGALLVGYVSRLLGMYIPGSNCVINSISTKLHNPVFFGATVVIEGSVTQYNESLEAGRVTGRIYDKVSNKQYASFNVDYSRHHFLENNQSNNLSVDDIYVENDVAKKNILIIGGNGGIGTLVKKSLEIDYRVRTAGRNLETNDYLIDMSELNTIDNFLHCDETFEVIICSASDPLISAPLKRDHNLEKAVCFNSLGVVSLAEIAFKKNTKRMVFFSSTMGDKHNLNAEFATYALGKNILNSTLNLLSKKYAGKMEIYNVVLGNMFTGLTAGTPEIKIKKYNLDTVTKKGIDFEELNRLIKSIVMGKLTSLSGNEIRLTSGL